MKISVPFFSLKRQWQQLKPAIMPHITEVLDSQYGVGGPNVESFEKALAIFTNSNYAVSCNSGTDALWIALKALDIKRNDIVLTTPFSFIASSSEIYAHGAHPLFIDVDSKTFNISPRLMQEWLERNAVIENGTTYHRTTGFPIRGIIAVDIFGKCFDVEAIKQIAEHYNLWIIEDAAQAIGAERNGKTAGTLGDITTFSLYPTKNLGACGDGGALTTNNKELAENIIRLRNHGRASHYNYEGYGINSRLDAIQAVIVREKLKFLPALTERRRAIAQHYNRSLADLPGIVLPNLESGDVVHQYCIQVTENSLLSRSELIEKLEADGIQTRIFYPEPLNTIPYLATHPQLATQTPITNRLCETVLALPIWPELSDDEVLYISNTIRTHLGQTVPLQEWPATDNA